jgi:hypothetical protein
MTDRRALAIIVLLHFALIATVPGYEEVATWKVAHWLPRTPDEVKLLKRKP